MKPGRLALDVFAVQDAQDAEDALKKFKQRIKLKCNRGRRFGRVYAIVNLSGMFGYVVYFTTDKRPIWEQEVDAREART